MLRPLGMSDALSLHSVLFRRRLTRWLARRFLKIRFSRGRCPFAFAMDTGENAELLALQRIDETCMQLQQKVRWVPIPHDQ